MPNIFVYMGYHIYFWSNESGEPIHVHVSKHHSENATKLWLLSNGSVEICHNKSKIPNNDIRRILSYISDRHEYIVKQWVNYFGYIRYIK